MSTPAPVRDARATRPAAPLALPSRPTAERPRPRLRPALVLPLLFAAAAAYHAVQGALHVSPAVFTDELLHSELARSLAAGEGLEIRGVPVFFPAFLPALLQAPAWLLGDTSTAYAVAKALNALVMSAAVFPAYWLARQLVRPSYALLAAAAAVAAPALVYHQYLLSEALAYPVFLATFAVLVRTLARPSPGWGVLAVAASLVAVGTRVQFVALPLVFVLLLAAGPRDLRRHAVAAAGLALLALLALVGGRTLLGTYNGVLAVDADAVSVAHWAAATAALLPFAAGLLVVPGALLGLGSLALRPRAPVEAAFARLALGVGAVTLAQAGIIAAGDSERPLERYAIYLVPLLVIAFFAYAERGAPHRRAHLGLAAGLALGAWLVPFSTLADYRFSFDSPVLSAFGELAHVAGTANAATIFAALPLLALAAAARPRPHAVGAVTIALLLVTGLAAYAADHAMTQRARAAWTAPEPDWLDRGGWGRADFLALPGGSPHFGWTLEAWNRDFGRPLRLGVDRPSQDPWAAGEAAIAPDGTLLVDGTPAPAGRLVVNDFATQIRLEGDELAHPRAGLRLFRVPEAPRVHALAHGLYHDGLSTGALRYRTWPDRPDVRGVYRVAVALAPGLPAREVAFAVEDGPRRVARLAPGASVAVELAADAADELRVTSDRSESLDDRTANPRTVGFRVLRLEFVPRPTVGL
jgi:hypothetical protein